jgi:hypothetical protein
MPVIKVHVWHWSYYSKIYWVMPKISNKRHTHTITCKAQRIEL